MSLVQSAISPPDATRRPVLSMSEVFRNPINPGADPTLVYHAGFYYLATTQGDGVRQIGRVHV